MDKDKLNELASKPVGRLLWQYSLPAVVGMLVMALYNVVDRIFIGQWVGPTAIAGLAVTFPVMNLATAIGVLVGVGAAARVSIDLGAGEKDKAAHILGNTLTLTILNAAIYIAIFTIFIDPMLRAFGASDATIPYARSYMLYLMPGLLLTNIAFGFNNIMRASGYPSKAMFTMLIGAVVNVILDPIFIYILDWGIVGAAIATDIAMAASAIFVMWHFCRPDVTLHFRRGTYALKWHLVWGIVTIGAAPALVNAASCFINALVNNSLLRYGNDLDIAAAGIMITYTSLLVTVVLGICQGLQPIIGYNYGAGNSERLRHAFFLAVGAASILTLSGAIFGIIWPREIGMAFTSDETLLDATERALSNCLLAFPIVGFQVVSSCLFQSIGKATKAIILGLLRQVLFLIPLLYILPSVLQLDGVWLSFPLSDALATLVALWLVVSQLRSFRKPHGMPQPQCAQ